MGIDYDKISERYDRFRRRGGPQVAPLVGLAERHEAKIVLELGPGTGNVTAAFLERYPCRLVGLELSSGMLTRGRSKGMDVRWVRGSALHIPLADRSVQFVYGCYMLHHVASVEQVFLECARVLGTGAAAFVTAPRDFILRHPLNRYFPSFGKIDAARFPSEGAIEAALTKAGFRDIGLERIVDEPIRLDETYIQKVAHRFVSTLELIPEEEFDSGLQRLRADVDSNGGTIEADPWELLVVSGCR